MTTKDIIGIVLIAAVIVLAIDKCNHTPVTPPDIQKAEQLQTDRKQLIQKVDDRETITQTILKHRWRVAHHYDTIIQTVLKYDSSETNTAFDSLGLTKNKAVVNHYQRLSDSIQLTRMDSVHVNDSLDKVDLRMANLKADSVIAIKDRQIQKE